MAIGLTAKRVAIVLACIAASLVLLALAAIWLAGRESTLQSALQRLAAASDGTLTIEGTQGSLYGPVKIRRIVFEDAKQRIEARDIELDWVPSELLDRMLHIKHLRIATLEVRSKVKSDEPLRLPASLRLPLAIKIDQARLATLSIGGKEATPVVLKDLAANAESTGATHMVNLTAIDSPWASGIARVELGADKPFTLRATGHATGRAPRAYTLDLKAGGSLEVIDLAADGATRGGKATLQAMIAPFAKAPFQSFTLNARDVDLHDLDAALPFTQLAAAATGNIDDKGAVAASVNATNTVAGTIDQQRIPLKSLKGQVAGTVDRFTAKNLAIDLGNAGQFTGEGGLADGRVNISLATKNLNVQGVYGKLRATQAAGTLALDAWGRNFAEQRVQADLNESKLAMRLRIDAAHSGDELRVDAAQLMAASGELSARGKLGLGATQHFDLAGKLTRFNPAAFGKFPVARIGADVRAAGQLAAPLMASVEFTLADSTLRGQPLAGHGRLAIAQNRIAQADVTLDLAGNQLNAKGTFGRVGDELAWQVDATDLSRLDSLLGGRARGKGVLRGTLDDPAGAFELTASALRVPGQIAIATLEAHGDVAHGKDGAIDVHIVADGVKRGGLDLTRAQADVTGTRTRHTLQLVAQGPQGIDLTSELSGGWDARQGWSGQIAKLANRGRYALELRAPAPLAMGPGRFELRDASLTLADGRLDIQTVNWSPGKLATRGVTTGLSVAWLQKLFPAETRADDVKATLTLGGRWSLEIGEAVNGSLRLAREAGDLTLVSDPPLALGLTQLGFAADIVQNRVNATFDLQGKTAGTLSVRAATLLAQREGVWGLPGDAELNVEANGDVPSLAWTALFLNPGYAVDGRAKLRLTRSGSVKAPRVSGTLEADGLALRVADYGVNLRDGVLRATFEENRVVLTQFRMRADEGELTANGSLKLGQTQAGIAEGGADIHADQLAILNHPDYQLTVSGDGKLAFAGGKLAVTGEVRADKGAIRLPDNNRPGLSDDVVVVRDANAKVKKPGATPISIDLLLDVGREFTLRGYGLEASLRGSLRVKSAPPGLPRGTGTIRVARGTYQAYGQKLEIERGVLSFLGPIDNPSLDILAVRKNLAVEPGVAITGTALGPRVKLVSDPTVPDTEKLAWLVLGHGLEGSSGGELDLLPVAAAALLSSNGRGPTKGIAQTFGLDEIGLSRNSASATGGSAPTGSSTAAGSTLAEQRVLTVGKRISSKLYLTYEAGLNVATRVVRLQYEISSRWSVRAETGTRSALDLFYTLRFD